MYLLVFYAPSIISHLGFEPGDSDLCGVEHSSVLGDALQSFTGGGKKNKQVDNNQSKLSRDTSSPQEEEDTGTSCSSLRAWTRMLQDEGGHLPMPWQLVQEEEP